jgi:ATP-dependent DNA helicase RecQ
MRRAKTEADRQRLSALLDYARNVTQCRRQALIKMLNYDSGGETPETQCCDVCEQQASAALREESSIVDFFRRNKRRYTTTEAASVLAQAEQSRWSEKDAKLVIDHLMNAGKLRKSGGMLWKGAVTLPRRIQGVRSI